MQDCIYENGVNEFAPSEIHTSKGQFTLRGEKTKIKEWEKRDWHYLEFLYRPLNKGEISLIPFS